MKQSLARTTSTYLSKQINQLGEALDVIVANGSASFDTIRNYRSQMILFLKWCARVGCNPLEATEFNIKQYRFYLINKKRLEETTIAFKLTVVRRLYDAAIELNPGFAQAYHGIGFAYAFEGRPAEAIPYFETAIRLSPHDPHLTSFMAVRAFAYLTLREYDKAVESAEGAIRQPNAMIWPHVFRTSALGHLGGAETAGAAVRDLLRKSPGITCRRIGELLYYTKRPEDLDHCLDGLRRAGVPE